MVRDEGQVKEKIFYIARNRTKRLYWNRESFRGTSLRPSPKYYHSKEALRFAIINSDLKNDEWDLIQLIAKPKKVEKMIFN